MTERVPGCNLRIFPNFPLPSPSQARRWLASSPIGRAKGGCAAGVAASCPCAADVRRTSFIFKSHPSGLFPKMIRRFHIRFRQIEPLGQLPQLGVPGLERLIKILSR